MIAWLERRTARRRLATEVALWHHPDYGAPDRDPARRVPTLRADRGELVLASLARWHLITARDVQSPRAATLQELGFAHDPEYLERCVEPATLAHVFGVDVAHVDVDALLAWQRRSVGGTVAAAVAVTTTPLRIGFNLGGGFHHAEPARGSGFCVYNDVAVAVRKLRRDGYTENVAIVDLDYHQGNGNLVAFADDATVLTYSIHGATWTEQRGLANHDLQLPPRTDDARYLEALRGSLPALLRAHRPGLVFYIAGNDVLAGDALGDFILTPAGVLERDRFVVEQTRALDARLVITLAGGYSASAWRCSASLARWLLTGVARSTRHPEAALRREFRAVARRLAHGELTRPGEDLTITDADVLADLAAPHRVAPLILGYYSRQGIELALERYGLLQKIRDRGFEALRLELAADRPSGPLMRIVGSAGEQEHVLLELVLSRRYLAPPLGLTEPQRPLELLAIDWLLLQDPTRDFTSDRPRLPGQRFPGLGLALEVQELLLRVCERLGLEGTLSTPAHYHNAVLAGPSYQFLEPRAEGTFRAMRRVLANHGMLAATRAVERSQLRLADGTQVAWVPSDHVLPASPRLRAYFASEPFAAAADAACEALLARGLHVVDL